MIALLGLALAGDAGAVELSVWHSYRGAEREALELLLKRYDEEHEELSIQPLAVPNDSYSTKLESAIPRGNGPDLFLFAHERVGDWEAKGLIVPLELEDGHHPVTVDALTWQDRVWGVPLAAKCIALIYNPELVEVPPATTHELLALQAEAPFALAWQATDAYYNVAWLHGFGGGVFRDGKVALDQPGNAEGMALALELAALGPQDPTGSLVTQLFNDRQVAMVINGPWFLGEIDEGVPFAVAPLPVVSETGLPAAPFLTVDAAFVSAHSEHQDWGRELARWLGREGAFVRATQGRQLVSWLPAYEDPAVSGDAVIEAFREQMDASVPMPTQPEMAATWEPMARAWRRVMRGAHEPETALAAAQTEFSIVSRPPAAEADPRPYVVLLGAVLLALLAWVGRSVWRARRELVTWRFAYAYVAPASIAMTLLVVTPFVVGSAVSLFAHHQGEFTFVGMSHYLDILFARDWPLSSPQSFWFTLVVTVLWTVANVALHVGLGIALAMLLREPWVRLRGVFRVLLILPWAIPNYITALIWKGMFHYQFGAINGVLDFFGVEPVSWFGSFSTSFAANLATNTWLGFPFMMVVTLGALQSIPRELEQAAEVDGASGWQRFRHITLPLLKPALLPAVVLGSVWTFNMFNIIYLVSGGEPDGSTEILISEAYRWAFTRQHQYGYASAYAVLIFFVLLGYSRLGNRITGQKVL